MARRAISRGVVYGVLAIGAAVFSFPFVWMISTSMKLDKELFRGQMDVLPDAPVPRLTSPFFDPRQFAAAETDSPQYSFLQPHLRERAAEALRELATTDADAESIVTLGLFDSLARRAPPAIWNGPTGQLLEYARNELTAERTATVARAAHRQAGIGSLRARSIELEDVELAADVAPAQRWLNRSPDVAKLTDATDATLPFAAISYDFSTGDRFLFENTFQLPFNFADVQRLQLRVRPDDTWHEMRITLEAAGARYVAERPVSLADVRWMTITLQKPGPDDHSTKLKTWLVLQEAARGPEFDHGPAAVRVLLEFRQRSPLQASFAKARHNFQRVVDQIPFWRYVRVSILLVILNIVLTLFSSSLVAYAFARLQWPGRDAMFLIMLGTMMIPGQVTMIPHFLIWKSVGAYNSLIPLYAGAAFGNAFFIFLMRQFLKGIPPDLEDAARIDGCGFLRIYWHVMLPLVKPSLAAIAIFTFMGTWNDFLGPLIYIADQRLYPLAFGLYAFSVQVNSNPVLTMAASLLMTLPVIAVFFLTQRWFVQGITLTGMKG